MAWMKEHFIQVIKSTFANPDVPVTGEFGIFGFCFNFYIIITLITLPAVNKTIEHGI